MYTSSCAGELMISFFEEVDTNVANTLLLHRVASRKETLAFFFILCVIFKWAGFAVFNCYAQRLFTQNAVSFRWYLFINLKLFLSLSVSKIKCIVVFIGPWLFTLRGLEVGSSLNRNVHAIEIIENNQNYADK